MSDDPVLAALARLEANAGRIEANVARLEANAGRIEANVARLEANVARIEANVGRLEANVARIEANVGRLEAGMARLETEQTRMREQFGNKLDDILDKLKAAREDIDNIQGHMLFGLQQNLTLSQRITKLEEEIRRPLT